MFRVRGLGSHMVLLDLECSNIELVAGQSFLKNFLLW